MPRPANAATAAAAPRFEPEGRARIIAATKRRWAKVWRSNQSGPVGCVFGISGHRFRAYVARDKKQSYAVIEAEARQI
jgi:hypothetical protein